MSVGKPCDQLASNSSHFVEVRDKLGNLYTKSIFDNYDFTARDQAIICKHVQQFVYRLLQHDKHALVNFGDFDRRHACSAQSNCNRQFGRCLILSGRHC